MGSGSGYWPVGVDITAVTVTSAHGKLEVGPDANTEGLCREEAAMGARSAEEAMGFFAASLSRRWGIVAAREYARLRLNRLSYVRAAPGARSGQLCSASGDADGTHCLFSAERPSVPASGPTERPS